MAHGLLDELRLWLHPLFVGQGGAEALIYSDASKGRFSLTDSVTLESGLVILTYHACPTSSVPHMFRRVRAGREHARCLRRAASNESKS
jgi:hypothetical protein